MEKLDLQLHLIEKLDESCKQVIEQSAAKLEADAGAAIAVERVFGDTIYLFVQTNGKAAGVSRYDLINYTYDLFSDKIPEQYRLSIKV